MSAELLQACRGSVKADLIQYQQMLIRGPESRSHFDRASIETEVARLQALLDSIDTQPPASSERVGLAVGAKLFSFSDFDDWRDTAKSKFKKAGTSSGRVVCVDQKGRICAWGEHFIAAREEGAYPIDAFLLRQDMDGEAAHGIAPRPDEATGQINEPASGMPLSMSMFASKADYDKAMSAPGAMEGPI